MPEKFQDYWDKNIDLWGEKYLDISHGHEKFNRPAWFTAAYNATIGQLERKLMKERYRRTIELMDLHVKPGSVFSDLGCGTGIFVVEAAKRGASVNAIDFSESALASTRRNVEANVPGANVKYVQADLQNVDNLPESDVSLAMGVTPYLTSIDQFTKEALSKTHILCVQYTDPYNWASIVRKMIPALDVRSLQCYDPEYVDGLYTQHRGLLYDRRKFASGFIDQVFNIEKIPAQEIG